MSKIEELIQRLCPNGVEWKKLLDIACVQYGYPFDSKQFTDSAEYMPLIRIRDVLPASASTYYKGKIENDYIVKRGDILVGMDGNFNLEKWNDRDGLLNQRVCKIYSKGSEFCINGYLYHILKPLFKAIEDEIKGGTVKHLSAGRIAKIEIPLPPLPVQEEIVRILDAFTSHAAELQAELQARREQYEYYRDKLLSFEGDSSVEWKPMGEVGEFIRGKRFVRTDIVSEGVPCIHYGDMYTYYGLYATESKGRLKEELKSKMRYAQKNDVVIVAAGENKEDIGVGLAWLGEEPAAVHDACFIFRSNLNPRYVSHYLRTDYYHKQIVKHVSEAKICSISSNGLGKAIIPIPSNKTQTKIADILDKFEALVNDLTDGLPAEIAARQEQYEYYRDKLLNFPKAV